RLARRGGAPLISPRVARAPGIPRAVIRIALGMAANAGFLFALTLHVQGGLGHSPLRTGLTFVPTAVAFGIVGLNWQRLPARWHAATVPGGFLLAARSPGPVWPCATVRTAAHGSLSPLRPPARGSRSPTAPCSRGRWRP
ncbi:hypothetical protein ACWGJ7_41085, partial [Streptomyces tendae]